MIGLHGTWRMTEMSDRELKTYELIALALMTLALIIALRS